MQSQQFAQSVNMTHARTQKMRARARKLQLADVAGAAGAAILLYIKNIIYNLNAVTKYINHRPNGASPLQTKYRICVYTQDLLKILDTEYQKVNMISEQLQMRE